MVDAKKKIAIVQPVLAPYAKERFEELAKDDNLQIVLLIEGRFFRHRPGWNITEVKGCQVEIIDSHIAKERIENVEQGYIIEGVRTIPYRLPLLLLKYRPHIILVCNATEFLFSYPLKPFLRCKIGVTVEDTIHAVKNKSAIKKRLKATVYRKADFYLPFSNDAVEYLKSIKVKQPIFRTSWSIDLQKFSFTDPEKICIIRNNLKLNDKIKFITVGQLIPGKGIINLLQAWKELPQEIRANISLIILGDGAQRNEISNYIRDNRLSDVFMLGHLPHSEVIEYYCASDVFILPTLGDLFSLVVMEAMACVLPVLTSIYNGARELVIEDKNGYIFDSADIDAIKEIIIRVYKQKRKLKRMGRASYEIIENYAHDRVMSQLKEILLNV